MALSSRASLETFGYLFYVVSPNKTSFEHPDEVPNYINEVVPYFIVLLLLEFVISKYKKRKTLRINDGIGSIAQGMLQQLSHVVFKGLQFAAYFHIYENYRIATLPWDSVWTWILCFLGVDLAYYWLHRASHEINILWASHQVHHSSEDYNLSTALRQSVLQNYSVWMFYLPMAFAIPPSVFLVHNQFNTLYQFWIHTELIDSLGPLEYILNTASHHRVHHGRNRYCIDKNYAGTLIIWDRIFGTFEPENKEVVYGLTHPINTFQSITIQFCHYAHIWRTFWATEGFKNKLSVLIKGPGWSPGKRWHGDINDIPDIHAPQERFNVQLPFWCNVYVIVHFVLILIGHIEVTERHGAFTQTVVLFAIFYQIFSLTSIGALLDGRSYAGWLELLRCISFLFVDRYVLPDTRLNQFAPAVSWTITYMLRASFIASALLWTAFCLKAKSIIMHQKEN